jgi:hypothetical protein
MPKTKAPSKVEVAARAARPFLHKGIILSVDPSIGSANSQPGYSLVIDGEMVDSGTLNINHKAMSNKRLADIQSQLLSICANPDVLIIEKICPMLSVGGAGVIQLHWACGAILATYPLANTVLVPNMTWKKHLRDHGLDNYKKSDEADAIALMLTVYGLLNSNLKNEKQVHAAIL